MKNNFANILTVTLCWNMDEVSYSFIFQFSIIRSYKIIQSNFNEFYFLSKIQTIYIPDQHDQLQLKLKCQFQTALSVSTSICFRFQLNYLY